MIVFSIFWVGIQYFPENKRCVGATSWTDDTRCTAVIWADSQRFTIFRWRAGGALPERSCAYHLSSWVDDRVESNHRPQAHVSHALTSWAIIIYPVMRLIYIHTSLPTISSQPHCKRSGFVAKRITADTASLKFRLRMLAQGTCGRPSVYVWC